MKWLRAPRMETPTALAMGAFDGLHRGHQVLIDACLTSAMGSGAVPAVLCFEPLPREYFNAAAAPARLLSARERYELLAQRGLSVLVQWPFNERLRLLTAAQFVEQLLVDRLRARAVVVGADFRFGFQRQGDVEYLREAGRRHGFTVETVAPVLVDGQRVSSTRVRQALASADFAQAEVLLGRPYALSGRVVPGRQLGRELGFPTANLRLRRRVSPLHGVYAVRVDGAGLNAHPGVASIGTRPTIDGGGEWLLEVHLIDYASNLYRQRLSVRLVAKLRDEQRFSDLTALTCAMHQDLAAARVALGI